MSNFKLNAKILNRNETDDYNPQVAEQNTHQQSNCGESTLNEVAQQRPIFQYPLQTNVSYNQQYSPWSPHSPQITMPNENFLDSVPVDLIVSNLDISIDCKEICNMLVNMFKSYCTILNLTVGVQGNLTVANVKVSNYEEAQTAVCHLDSRFLGCKRITVSYACTGIDQLRMVVISLLKSVPDQCMSLFKFFEIVRSRYFTNISLAEVNSLQDVCSIIEASTGRMIVLNQKLNLPFPIPFVSTLKYYCSIHCPNSLTNQGWGEAFDFNLPNVRISLRYFGNQLHQLLTQHNGYMPLLSFSVCYALQFKQSLPEDASGVPLEHLITCFPTVELISNGQNRNVKFLRFKDPTNKRPTCLEEILIKTVPPVFFENVSRLCCEMVELLKNLDKCHLLVNYYIPAYYSHFGRECRLSDYGFNRFSDLFEAISDIVQILGYGSKQIMTLSHSVQIRRFTIDLLRVIRLQKSKKLSISLFPYAYEKIFSKTFNPVDYGLCSLEDLLCNIQENIVVISKVNDIDVVSIFKREQTVEQIRCTALFGNEVKEILRHFPYCTMPFNNFLQSYQHCFGRECKVRDYGFTKLAELFEAISEIVEVDGFFDMDRTIKLTLEPHLEVVGNLIAIIIKRSNIHVLHANDTINIFLHTFGYNLKPEALNCTSFLELFIKLSSHVQVHYTKTGLNLSVVEIESQVLEIRLWSLLLQAPHQMELKKLNYLYRLKYETNLPTHRLTQLRFVEVSKSDENIFLTLTPFFVLAAEFYHILAQRETRTQLSDLIQTYRIKYGKPLELRRHGARSFKDLLLRMNFLVVVNERDSNLFVTLNKRLSDHGVTIYKPIKPELFNWPPPPFHQLTRKSVLITPPKPDTPPLPGCWSDSYEFSKEYSSYHINLQVPIPIERDDVAHISQINPNAFISNYPQPTDKYFIRDDSGYSGFNASKQDFSISDVDTSQRHVMTE